MTQFVDSYTIFIYIEIKSQAEKNTTFIKNNLFYSGLQNLKVVYQEVQNCWSNGLP